MHQDQSANSRFGGIAAVISETGTAIVSGTVGSFYALSERIASKFGPRSEQPRLPAFGTMGHRNRWRATSTAVGALSLGMATVAIGSLIMPQTQSEIPLATQQTNVRVIASLPEISAPVQTAPLATVSNTAPIEAPSETQSGFFSNPFADDATIEPVIDAPFNFTTAYALVTQEIRRTASEIVSVGRGDTLMGLLTDAGALRMDAYNAIAAMKPLYDPRKLRAGQELLLSFDETVQDDDEGRPEVIRTLTSMTMQTDVDREISISRIEDGAYAGLELIAELETGNVRAHGTINSSLFLAANAAGVPAAITIELIRMYSYDIDFQREIRQGDTFEVLFTRDYDEDGTPVREGNVLYASMNVGGKERSLWRYEPTDGGNWDYFDEKGRSMRKFLMKTPIDGARISSSFGNRRHPILGYTRLHSGTDFAAPSGTPIYAAGNGTIQMAQRNGGYGNYVRIRHANGYQTAYAHMRRFGRGIRKGVRVRQGQIIGYVGTTGRSTGPHLHYEVIRNGTKVNPQRIRVPTGRTLGRSELTLFETARANTNLLMAEAPAPTRLAEAEIAD
ncbi:MAG: peptidase M23 [Rhodobiaceae bacterium]|nr:MAG: peptidase M23 [Rhodobiaceae bacterium]